MSESMQELQKYKQIIGRRKKTFIFTCILITSAVIVSGYMYPKEYRADSTVFVEENIIRSLVEGLAYTSEVQDYVKVLKDAMLSRSMIKKVLDGMEPDLVNNASPITQSYISSLQQKTKIKVKGEELFTVSIDDRNPLFAEAFINGLVRGYVEENMFVQREATYGANRFFDEQLEIFKQKLDGAEDAIIEFRKKQKTYLSLNETTILQDLRRLSSELEGVEVEKATIKAKQEAIAKQLESIDQMIDLDKPQSRGRERLAALESRLDRLASMYTDNYPEVIRVRAEIEEERARLLELGDEELENEETGEEGLMTFNPVYVDTRQRLLELEAELSSKESMKARLEGLIKQKEQLLQEIPENQKQLNVLEQERDSARKIYEELLKRQGQAEVSKQMEIGDKTLNFRLVDPAITPKHPVSPNLQLFMLVAVLGGLAGAFGVALLLDGLGSSSIRSVNEIEDFDVEILGSIPYLDTKKERVKKNISRATVISIMSIYYLCVVGLFIYETYFRWEQ